MDAMMKHILYLFPDTNLFIQCYPLQQLDWSEWAAFEEVHLIVCRPVQREIDDQKTRGNNRVSQRARTTYQVFRSVIDSECGFLIVQDTGPKVKLYVEGPSLPSQDLTHVLDYRKPDDEVVGCLHRFRQENNKVDARLLTHDAGPMMTAKTLGLPFVAIQEAWLLPPEHNETERDNARLKNEIDRLKKLEPSFQIRCLDEKDREIQEVEVEYKVFEPLGDDDIEELIELLKRRVPMATKFGAKGNAIGPTTYNINAIMPGAFVNPPSSHAIAQYKGRDYPEWIEHCRLVLSNLHKSLQRKCGLARIRFAIKNAGTRPGRDTLIDFRARGDFKLAPPQEDRSDWIDEEEGISLRLLPPPEPPRSQSVLEGLANITSFDYPEILASSLQTPSASEHDHNAFYYKPEVPMAPASLISLACDQWRHGNEYEDFVVEIFADANSSEVTGQLECVVQAENLSSPATEGVSIRINVIKENTKDYAYDLICGRL